MKLRGWTAEQRKAMSDVQKLVWVKRNRMKHETRLRIASYAFAETQLASFDKLRHDKRVQVFMDINFEQYKYRETQS